jgi:hypothetical protein
MNNPDDSLSDEMLDKLLAASRLVAVPDETRAANRAAVERALARHVQLPWWRKTIAVPLPAAIAATVALAVTVTVLFWQSHAQPRGQEVVSQPLEERSALRGSSGGFREEATSRSNWSVTRSYIQTLGAFGNAENHIDLKIREKQDES